MTGHVGVGIDDATLARLESLRATAARREAIEADAARRARHQPLAPDPDAAYRERWGRTPRRTR